MSEIVTVEKNTPKLSGPGGKRIASFTIRILLLQKGERDAMFTLGGGANGKEKQTRSIGWLLYCGHG